MIPSTPRALENIYPKALTVDLGMPGAHVCIPFTVSAPYQFTAWPITRRRLLRVRVPECWGISPGRSLDLPKVRALSPSLLTPSGGCVLIPIYIPGVASYWRVLFLPVKISEKPRARPLSLCVILPTQNRHEQPASMR